MAFNNEQSIKFKAFVNACNEFIAGKFILADIKIAKILKAIANSEEVYNLLAECMINFNFKHEIGKCYVKTGVEGKHFTLPVESFKLIPLVFCLLVSLDSKKIDLNEFLVTQFPGIEGQNEQYAEFANIVVKPFRNAVADILGVAGDELEAAPAAKEMVYIDRKTKLYEDDNDKPVVEEETVISVVDSKVENELNEFYGEVKKFANIIIEKASIIKNNEKRENIKLIASAIERTCVIQDLKILSALVTALNEIGRNEKHLKQAVVAINNCYTMYVLNQK